MGEKLRLKRLVRLVSLAVALGLFQTPAFGLSPATTITAGNANYASGAGNSSVVPNLPYTLGGSGATGISGSVSCNAYPTGTTVSNYGSATAKVINSSLAAGSYPIICTAAAASGYTAPTLTAGTLTVVAGSAFSCTANFYQFSNGVQTGSGTNYYVWKLAPSGSSFTFTAISGAGTTALNGAGWNPTDNYIYGLSSSTLYRVDSNGLQTSLGTVVAGTGAAVNNTGGDFVKVNGTAYLLNHSTAGAFDLVNVANLTASKVTVATGSATWKAYDATVVKNQVMYGLEGGTGTSGTLDIATINSDGVPADESVTVTQKTVSGLTSATASDTYGAAYSDSSGNVYFYGNTSLNLYEITAAQLQQSAPVATLVTTSSTKIQSPNDGASCPTADSPTAPTVTTSSSVTSITATSAHVSGTISTPNITGSNVVTGSLQFCYATTQILLSSAPTCVNSTPDTATVNETTTPIAANFSGLSSGTLYYFQAKATNATGSTANGSIQSFTTLSTWAITANNASYTIGGSVPSLAGSAVPSAGLSGSLTCGAYTDTSFATPVTINSSLAAGSYPIHCTGTAASGYASTPSYTNGTLQVTSLLSWTITANSVSYTPGGSVPSIGGSASPLAGLSGSLTCAAYRTNTYASVITIDSTLAVGSYPTHCTGTAASGYASASLVDGLLTVSTTPWTLTAQNAAYTVGGSVPLLTAAASPSAALKGSATCSAYANSDTLYQSPVIINSSMGQGTYVIRCTGTPNTGYNVSPTIVTATLTVTTLTTWTLTASGGTYNYGGSAPSITGTASPLAGETGTPTCGAYTDNTYGTPVTLNTTTAVGTYITHCTGTGASGYTTTPTSIDSSVVVTANSWSITASAASYAIGGSVPNLTGTASPVGALSGSLSCYAYSTLGDPSFSNALTINSSLAAGTYTIHCTGAPATGYSGSPTITNALLTVSSLYVVTFDSNTALSGSPSVGSVTQASAGASVNLATVGSLAKTGYTFQGWAANRSDTVTVSNTYTPASSITLYAVWKINNYTITFDPNSGSITAGSSTASITYNVDALPSAPTVSNGSKSLVGWNTDSSSVSALSTYPATGAATLYAIWSMAPVLYTVTFNGNSPSSGSPATDTATQASSGASVALSAVGTLAKTGYTFGGWSLSGNAPALSGSTYTPARTLTLYAIWNINSYHVIFNANGGSITSGADSSTVNYNADAIGVAPTVAYTYYHLAGWNTDSTTSTGLSTYTVTGDVTLYAIWAANYTVTFSRGSSGSGTASPASATQSVWGGSVSLAGQGTMAWPGHTFTGWSTNGMAPTLSGTTYTPGSSLTLYAVWTLNSYTVTYDANGGSISGGSTSSATFDYGATNAVTTAPTATRVLYDLVGWNTDSSSSSDIGAYTVTSSVTFYAIWNLRPVLFTVSFNANGASGAPSVTSVTQASTGASVALASLGGMSKTGYSFAGWSASGTAPALTGPNYTPGMSTTLYAIWTINSYQVTYNANGGSFNGGETTTTVTRTYHFNLLADTAHASETRTGYTFIGWNTDSSSATALEPYLLGAGSVTLYAIWSNAPVVEFDCGTDCEEPAMPYTGTGLTLPTPTKTGYTFASWNTASGGGGSTASSPYVPTTTITLYAVWTIKHYSVVFDAGTNGGAYSDSSTTVVATLNFGTDAIAYASAHSLTPSIDNGTFQGWNSDQGQGTTFTTYSVDDSADTQTLYAIYLGTVTYVYSISYDGNGSDGGTPVATQSGAAVSVTLSANTFSRSGYTFLRWNTNTGGTGTNYQNGQTINLTTDINVTLFAQWSANAAPPSGGTLQSPTITWVNPANINYPTPLSGVQLNASSGGVPGTWAYTPAAGTILRPGTYTLSVIFTPTNGSQYSSKSATVTIKVLEKSKSNPTITWANPLPIYVPTALSSTQLNAACSVPAKLVYTPSLGTVLAAGIYALHVECDPNETENYNSVSAAVRLVVNAGTPGSLAPVVPPTTSTPPGSPNKKPVTPPAPQNITQPIDPNIVVPTESGTSSIEITHPEAPGAGIQTATIENNNLVSTPEPTFSGKTTVSVTVTNNGNTQTFEVPVVVLPAPALAPLAQPNNFQQGQVNWVAVPNATGYEVSIRGKVVCQTTDTTCSVPQTVGPATPVTITSLGNDDTANHTQATVIVPKAIPALTVHFATNSAVLTADDKKLLKSAAKTIKTEGFTQIILKGHTDSVGGVDNTSLSKARAAATQDYLGKLVPTVTFKSGAFADRIPVADNATDLGKAANRRTDVLVR